MDTKLKLQRLLAVMIATIGILLLTYMITVENEPGALPLLLITSGTGWLLVTYLRSQK